MEYEKRLIVNTLNPLLSKNDAKEEIAKFSLHTRSNLFHFSKKYGATNKILKFFFITILPLLLDIRIL